MVTCKTNVIVAVQLLTDTDSLSVILLTEYHFPRDIATEPFLKDDFCHGKLVSIYNNLMTFT